MVEGPQRRDRAPADQQPHCRIASTGNFGDFASVGEGVSDLRIHVGAGYRVYYTLRDGEVVILLCGGAKDSQDRDIKRAREMAASLE